MEKDKPTVALNYVGQNSETHNHLVELLLDAWTSLDPNIIEPLLAEDLHYYSWWVMSEIHSKSEYMDYIRGKFTTLRESGNKPIVKLGISSENGEYAVALQQGDNAPALIRIEERDGKIKEMWMQGLI